MANEFIVGTGDDRFVMDVDGNAATVTNTPSNAAHLPYDKADALCQRLRKRGYPQARVCDIIGNPMTIDAIRAMISGQTQTPAAETLPANLRELSKIPAAEQLRRYRQSPAFAKRFDELDAAAR
jgi:hypothetical protein